MNSALIHLILNHWPILTELLAVMAALLFFLKKNHFYRDWTLIFSGLFGILTPIVYITGRSAQHLIKNYPNVFRIHIENHHNLAFYLLLLSLFQTLVTAIYFLSHSEIKKKIVFRILFFFMLFNLLGVVVTTHYGYQIRHEEIRNPPDFSDI